MWIHPEQNGTEAVFLSSPHIVYMGPDWLPDLNEHPITGRLVYTEEYNPSFDLNGVVLIYSLRSAQCQEDAAELLKDRGLAALITLLRLQTSYPGMGNWLRKGGALPNQPFPLFEISEVENSTLKGWFQNQTGGVFVSIGNDDNPWNPIYTVAVRVFQFVVLIFSGTIAIIAVYKLSLIISVHGIQLSMAQVILSLDIIGSVLKIIWTSWDPFEGYGIGYFLFDQVFLTISYPFSVAGCLLIALYWHEMIIKTGNRINMFLDKLRIPFLIFSGMMMLFELAVAICRGLYLNMSILQTLDGVIYVIVSLAVLLFFIVTRVRLQRIFNQLNKDLNNTRNGRKLSVATTKLTIMICLMSLWIIMLVIVGITNLIWIPTGFVVLWFTLYVSVMCVSLTQVLLIRAPGRPIKWFFCGLCGGSSLEDYGVYGNSDSNKQTSRSAGSPPTSARSASAGKFSTSSDTELQ